LCLQNKLTIESILNRPDPSPGKQKMLAAFAEIYMSKASACFWWNKNNAESP